MASYRRKTYEIEATQWQPGLQLPGIDLLPSQIQYNEAGDLYTIRRGCDQSKYWFGVEKLPGPVPEELKHGKLFDPAWLQVDTPQGDTYHRKMLNFTLWKVAKGKCEPIGEDSELFKDYAAYHEWPETAQSCILKAGSQTMIVSAGDWIVRTDGDVAVVRNSQFLREYEPTS